MAKISPIRRGATTFRLRNRCLSPPANRSDERVAPGELHPEALPEPAMNLSIDDPCPPGWGRLCDESGDSSVKRWDARPRAGSKSPPTRPARQYPASPTCRPGYRIHALKSCAHCARSGAITADENRLANDIRHISITTFLLDRGGDCIQIVMMP